MTQDAVTMEKEKPLSAELQDSQIGHRVRHSKAQNKLSSGSFNNRYVSHFLMLHYLLTEQFCPRGRLSCGTTVWYFSYLSRDHPQHISDWNPHGMSKVDEHLKVESLSIHVIPVICPHITKIQSPKSLCSIDRWSISA